MDNHGTVTGRWKGNLVFPQGRLVYPDRLSRGEQVVQQPARLIDYRGLERHVFTFHLDREMSAPWKRLRYIVSLLTSDDRRKRKRGRRLSAQFRAGKFPDLYQYWKD